MLLMYTQSPLTKLLTGVFRPFSFKIAPGLAAAVSFSGG